MTITVTCPVCGWVFDEYATSIAWHDDLACYDCGADCTKEAKAALGAYEANIEPPSRGEAWEAFQDQQFHNDREEGRS